MATAVCLHDALVLHARRSPHSVRCCNGRQRRENYSEDWDAAWEELKKKSLSGSELTKPNSLESNFEQNERDVGPRFTKWGGSVRGGKYRLGEGADRILDIWGNGDAALYAAMAVIVLFFVLLQFPPPSASS
ncbi:hypothetical protein KP509_10G023300 [Ceratopteris richardii]|uniref:Uncharacterized protein n=1 Tax=Ceratopteris richardii TaxID=49495 RepID=A0A8T2TTL2_CERRI|nr:hypothetical protein KP509_10G023300 [Ceratopteris richardii]